MKHIDVVTTLNLIEQELLGSSDITLQYADKVDVDKIFDLYTKVIAYKLDLEVMNPDLEDLAFAPIVFEVFDYITQNNINYSFKKVENAVAALVRSVYAIVGKEYDSEAVIKKAKQKWKKKPLEDFYQTLDNIQERLEILMISLFFEEDLLQDRAKEIKGIEATFRAIDDIDEED